MSMSLDEMSTFVQVVNCGSFSKAAEKTGIPVSTVSRQVANLESRLNTQLLYRTTRRQRLTDIGKVYYEHCSQMLQEAEAAELAVQNLKVEPTGVLRVTTPYVFEDPYASNMMQSFLQRYPKIQVDYYVSSRRIDLIEERYDCALVPGVLNDSSMRTRGLGRFRLIHCVSQGYISKYGTPKTNDSLSQHQYIKLEYPDWINLPSSEAENSVSCRLTTNDLFVARRSALGGIGMTCLPEAFILTQLEKGDLIHVLPEFDMEAPFNLVFPSNKQFTTKLRAFIDHIVDYTNKNSPWDYSN